jgi:hypothetical protein
MSLVSKKKRRSLRKKIKALADSTSKPFAVAKILFQANQETL